jgi:hypothetical protein
MLIKGEDANENDNERATKSKKAKKVRPHSELLIVLFLSQHRANQGCYLWKGIEKDWYCSLVSLIPVMETTTG